MSDWNSALYLKFERERTRAARDLLVQLPAYDPPTVYDLGCGPGNSTELLAQTFPNAEIVGINSSEGHVGRGARAGEGRNFHRATHRGLAPSP